MKKHLCYIILLLFTGVTTLAQDVIPTKGKEFWMGFMRNYLFSAEQSLDLVITSDVNTTGTVEMPLLGWSSPFSISANTTTIVTVPNALAETFASEVIDNRGIHILTEDTVSVFGVNFKPISADGSKILPIQSIGTEYIISSYEGHQNFGSQFLIVATEDDTEIEIIPTALTYGGVFPGESLIINLDQGQTYQVYADLVLNGDFMGTVIRSTENSGTCRPFAVFSGASCADIPTDCLYCDHIFDQNFSINTWGTEYYVPPVEFAPGGYTYRIMASQDLTQVTVNNLTTYSLNAGEFVEFNDQIISQCISADKPISVTQYFQGIGCAGDGDPSMLILNDANQVIDNVTFSTMESDIITSHGLNIISQTDYITEVTLDGVLIDPGEFVAFPPCPEFSYAQIAIPEGTHTLESVNGISAYVFGVGDDESYAYSVGSFLVQDNILELVDSVICSDTQVIIDANPVLSDVFWYMDPDETTVLENGSQLVLDVPFDSGVYISVGTDLNSGCIEEELFLVEFNQPPTITANDSEICKYESVQLDFNIEPATDIIDIQWTPSVGLDDPNILSPIASPLETTQYTVEVTSGGGCGTLIVENIEVEVLSGSISGIDVDSDVSVICEGSPVIFNGTVQDVVFEDNFDPGVSWGLWCDISNGVGSINCGSVTGAALYFNGFGNRYAATQAIDVSNGGTIAFSLKVASGVAPCDDTEFGEDIILEYSVDGCDGPYTEIETFLEFSYPNFEEINIPIPPGAVTTATHFRWRQVSNSGLNQDNWSLDDVYIGIVDNDAYEFIWSPPEIFTDVGLDVNEGYPTENTMVLLEVLDNISGCVYQDSVAITVYPKPEFTIPADSLFCSPSDISIVPEVTGLGSYDFIWNSSDGSVVDEETMILNVAPTFSTSYYLEVIDQGTTCSEEAITNIVISELDSIDLTSAAIGICLGDEVQMNLSVYNGTSDFAVEWLSSEDLTLIDDLNIQVNPFDNLTVDVLVTDEETGCYLTDSAFVFVSMPFSIQAPEDMEACNVIGTVLEMESPDMDPGELNWSWTPNMGLDLYDQPVATVLENTSQEYIITATNEYDCSAVDTVVVVLAFENFDLGEDIELCEGDTYVIETGYDNTHEFIWNGDTNLDDTYILVSSPGVYDVFIESSIGCTFEDELEVFYYPNPLVELGSNQSFCEGESSVLDAGNPGLEFNWNTNETVQTIEVDETGYYWVTITDENSCEDMDSVFVVFNELPEVDMPDTLLACDGQDIIIDAGNEGVSYLWNTGAETSIVIVEDTGEYSVEVTNEYGCVSSGETYADFGAQPVVVLPPDMHFCEGDTVTIEPLEISEGDYYWSNGSSSLDLTVAETGFYILTVQNEFCEDSDAISISVHPIPNSNLPQQFTGCLDDSPYGLSFAALWEDATYEWSTGETSSVIQIYDGGLYYVDITDPYGCVGRDSIYINAYCPDTALYIPNSFTPNNDGKNDHYLCIGRNIGEFEFQVFDRWGMLVWETEDIKEYWDGSLRESDYYLIKDTYTYIAKYRFVLDEFGTLSDIYRRDGYITLVR